MVTGPEGDNFSLVNNNNETNNSNNIKNEITVIAIVPPVVAKIIFIYLKHR